MNKSMDENYNEWIQNLKQRVLQVQLKAVVSVNSELLRFYWNLGLGFAYMGRQFKLEVGNRDFYIDLLFYHVKLYFYIIVVVEQLKKEHDEPTIGILLCKTIDKLIAEYALKDINKPIGISEYQLTQQLPDNLKSSLPTIEETGGEFRELGGADE